MKKEQFLGSDSDYQRFLEFRRFTDRLAVILFQKNTDYGNAIAETGVAGCEVRLYDKLKRLRNIIENGHNKVLDEPLEDSFWDTAGYAILRLMLEEKSSVFFDKNGNVIEHNNGTVEKRHNWLKKHKQLTERLIKNL